MLLLLRHSSVAKQFASFVEDDEMMIQGGPPLCCKILYVTVPVCQALSRYCLKLLASLCFAVRCRALPCVAVLCLALPCFASFVVALLFACLLAC